MCTVSDRVHDCGHYDRTLYKACKKAREARSLCTEEDSLSIKASTTLLKSCYEEGCDGKASPKREGPGTIP